MTALAGKGPIKRVQIEATVIRADGSVEELGRVADSSRLWNFIGRRFANHRIRRANARARG